MFTLNKTAFVADAVSSEIDPPHPSLTVLVKATFKITDDGALVAAEEGEHEPVQGDILYMDDIGRSLAYASDLEPYKVAGEILFSGACHQPNGVVSGECRPSIEISDWRKELVVYGDRQWVTGANGAKTPSDPAPFTSMPMRWENAFGGLDNLANPMGKGEDELEGDTGETYTPLPNIEDPGSLVRSPEDRLAPVNFAPLPPNWAYRESKFGTRDRRWATFVAPLPPKDFDKTYYNAAPSNQQFPHAFRGDEEIILTHLHSRHAQLRLKLPGVRVRTFLVGQNEIFSGFTEVPMALDTVQIVIEDEAVYLVWRGGVGASSAEAAEYEALYVVQESTSEEPRPVEVYHKAFAEETKPPERPADKLLKTERRKKEAAEAFNKLRDTIKSADLPDTEKAALLKANDPEKMLTTVISRLEVNMQKLKSLAGD